MGGSFLYQNPHANTNLLSHTALPMLQCGTLHLENLVDDMTEIMLNNPSLFLMTSVAANLYVREYVPMGIDSLRLGIDSL